MRPAWSLRPAGIATLLLALLTSTGAAQSALSSLHPELEARIARHHGTVAVSIVDLKTGDSLSIRGDEPYPSASIIKLPVLVELFQQVEAGRLRLEDPILLIDADKVPGSGVLQHLSTPHQMTIGDAALLMIILSDNTATNLVLDKVGLRAVGERMEALGLPRTKVHSNTFRRATSVALDSSVVYGLGVTTANEITRLLSLIYRGEAVSPEASKAMVEILKKQVYEEGIPRHLADDVVVAHKTGGLDAARHDCGIVYAADRDYALCILTRENTDQSWRIDNQAQLLIADLARMVHRHLAGRGPVS
jgi:beta-lactamase class A